MDAGEGNHADRWDAVDAGSMEKRTVLFGSRLAPRQAWPMDDHCSPLPDTLRFSCWRPAPVSYDIRLSAVSEDYPATLAVQ